MSTENVSRSDTTARGVGARIKALYEAQGMTQADFARAVTAISGGPRMTPQQLIKYETEGRTPDPGVLVRIAVALGTTVDALLRDAEPASAQPVQAAPAARQVHLDLADVTPPEHAVLFPLVRALLDLSRKSEDTFEQLLKQTRLAMRAEHMSLAPIDTAIGEFLRVKPSTTDVKPPTRKPRRAKGLRPR